MTRLGALLLAVVLGTGCLATASAHQGSRSSTTGKVAFVAFLPVLLAIDVATAPFQWWYVINRAR